MAKDIISQKVFNAAAGFLFESQDDGKFHKDILPGWISKGVIAALEQRGLVNDSGDYLKINAGLATYYSGLNQREALGRHGTQCVLPTYAELTASGFRRGSDWY